jgi:hypothetical protein
VSQVFISYSRRDETDVSLLARKLEDAGHKIWLDRSAIQGGAKWQEEIVRGIERANVFMILLSPQSVASENVERELGLAHVTRKRILPVMLQRVTVPPRLQYALAELEIIDVSAEDIAAGSQRVLQAIASTGARAGVVYLNTRWDDKLPDLRLLIYVLFLLGGLLKSRWIPIGALILILIAVRIGVWAFRRIYIYPRLRTSGIVLSTELKGFTKDPFRIVSEWRDPETGRLYRFYSDAIPSDHLKRVDRTIPVIVDPRNFTRYRMDLSFLPHPPREPRGSLVLSGPDEVASNIEGYLAGNIFLSHSEQDSKVVGLLVQKLEAVGHTVWRTKGAEGGDLSYEEQVIEGIAGPGLFLLVLSPAAVQSTRVRSELDLAVAKGKRIITAALCRTTVPQDVDYALASVQHVDLSEDFELGLMRLIDTIRSAKPKKTVVPETTRAALTAWLVPWRKGDLDKLKDRGTLLLTEYEGFVENADDNGHRNATRILSQWRDPVSHERYRFRSPWVACEPEHIRTKIIPVYVDPNNLRRYSVDLSFLPEDQRGEVPKRAPLIRRLRNRLLRGDNPIGEEASSATLLLREQKEVDSNRVFVSYSSENVDKAGLLIEQLEGAGYEVVNRSETDGTRLGGEESEQRISLARTLLIVVPSASARDLASKVLELRHAYTLNKRIIPVTFSDYKIPPSMQLSLAGVQCVDLSRDFGSGIRVLLNALPVRKSGRAPAPDHPKKVSPSLSGAPARRLVSSAMMGAFSWALGFTLSIVWLDRGSAMPGLIRIAPAVALAYGCVIGGIFYRRWMNIRTLLLLAFVSLVLFPVAVALFAPGHAINSGRDTLALMLTPVLGTSAFIGAKIIYVALFNYRLKKRGKLILTEYKGSGMSQWRDPVTDEVHTFVRGYSGILSKPIRSTTIAVFMDPANPSDYYMDLSYSPQSKE